MGDRPIIYALSGVAVLAAAGAAEATVQTRVVTGDSPGAVALARFDPSLGTLLSVNAQVSYLATAGYSNYTPAAGFDHPVTGQATFGGLQFDLAGATRTTDYGAGRGYFQVNASGSTTWSAASDLARLTGGTGTLSGDAQVLAAAPGTLSVTPPATVKYTVTYTYDDGVVGAVPEPATWAMMAGGFALVGLGLRGARRRRRVGAAARG